MTTIKLKEPNDLTEDNLLSVSFEAWQNQKISFLEHKTFHFEFISGMYTQWKAKQDTADGKRTSRLNDNDPDKKVIEAKTGGPAEAARPGEFTNLLIK